VLSGGEGCAIAISDANSDVAIWAQSGSEANCTL